MTRIFLMLTLAAALASPAGAANPRVKLETTKGTIVIELDQAKAPITVGNFLEYVKSGFYDGTVFHRVIPSFMIQGGGFTPNMEQKATRAAIVNESANGLVNKRGTLAMARTPDPNSATAQFFINLKDNGFLDKANSQDGVGYCVFGKVVEGMGVVDAIAQVQTATAGPHENVPTKPVVITKASVVGAAAAAKPPAPPASGQQKPR